MPDKIPCPVAGCDEEFKDEAEAMAHMKEKHRDDFAPAPEETPLAEFAPDQEKVIEETAAVAMVPPGMLKLLDERVEKIVATRIEAALTAYLPEVQQAVAGAMEKAVKQVQGALPGGLPGAGVIPGSPVTSEGVALLNLLLRQGGGGGSDMENLAKTLTQARAISDVLNPPSIWDRVMQNAVLRSLGKAGLVTDTEMKDLLEPAKVIK